MCKIPETVIVYAMSTIFLFLVIGLIEAIYRSLIYGITYSIIPLLSI